MRRVHRSFVPLATSIACLAGASDAVSCLWDRDSLAMEAKAFPSAVDVLTGRFGRYPARYYQMRRDRVARELLALSLPQDAERRLLLLDDLAVACDRLGHQDEALAWMEQKHAALGTLPPEGPIVREHRYRWLANRGTFLAHRWLSRGADRGHQEDLIAAEADIAAAIALNPDAHFGREEYQLGVIRWLLSPPDFTLFVCSEPTLLDTLAKPDAPGQSFKPVDPDRTIRGIIGLMALGNAWESIDSTLALAAALHARGDSSVAYLAALRLHELATKGHRSLHPGFDASTLANTDGAWLLTSSASGIFSPRHGEGRPYEEHARAIEAYYAEARAASEEAQAARWAFMERMFDQGQHPDTHSDFWSGWVEPPVTALPTVGILSSFFDSPKGAMLVVGASAIVVASALWVSRRRRQRRAR